MATSGGAKEAEHPRIEGDSPSIAKTLPVAVSGREALSEPFRYRIELIDIQGAGPGWADLGREWLGKQVVLDLAPLDPATTGPNLIRGLVVAAELLGAGEGPDAPVRYRIEVAPRLWLLSLTRRTRIFRDMTPLEVATKILHEADIKVEIRAASGKAPSGSSVPHLTQYDETDLDFLSRLLEDEGVCYWFIHGKTDTTMVLANEAGDFPGPETAIAIGDAGRSLHDPSGVGLRVALVPGEARASDYDFNDPGHPRLGSKPIPAARAPVRQGVWTVQGSAWTTTSQSIDAVAAIEADRHVNRACTFRGAARDPRFRAGLRVSMPGSDCLVTEVEMTWRHPQAAEGGSAYANRFAWVSWQAMPWRPPRTAPRPRLDGTTSATITATAGKHADQGEDSLDGSYTVRLLTADQDADRPARLAQPYGGQARGFHGPLPPDTEVLLAHIDGNPDRPVIAAVAPNVNHPGPVADANHTQTVLKTAAGHTLLFEDKAGEEMLSLASKSGNRLEMTDKGGGEKVLLNATRDHEATIAGTSATKVQGAVTIDSKDEITITAAKKITLKVGGASIVIEASGITISGSTVTAKSDGPFEAKGATMKLEASGPLEAKGAIIKLN